MKPQLDRARELVEEQKKQLEAKGSLFDVATSPKKKKVHFLRYIRILDAVMAGAKDKEIYDALDAPKASDGTILQQHHTYNPDGAKKVASDKKRAIAMTKSYLDCFWVSSLSET